MWLHPLEDGNFCEERVSVPGVPCMMMNECQIGDFKGLNNKLRVENRGRWAERKTLSQHEASEPIPNRYIHAAMRIIVCESKLDRSHSAMAFSRLSPFKISARLRHGIQAKTVHFLKLKKRNHILKLPQSRNNTFCDRSAGRRSCIDHVWNKPPEWKAIERCKDAVWISSWELRWSKHGKA